MKFSMIGLMLLTAALGAEAQPVFNAQCAKTINLRSPPGGAGVYFDRECKVAYVLPPTSGTVSVAGIARTSGLDHCTILNNFTQVFEIKSQQLADLVKRGIPRSSNPGNGSPLFPRQPEQPTDPVDENVTKYLDELGKLQDAYVKSRDKLRVFWEMPGATAQITYEVRHQDLVEQYQRLNPTYVFRNIQLHGSKIYLARKVGKDDSRTTIPAVLGADLPGSHRSVHDTGELAESDGIIAGEAQSGQLMLSLLGAGH